MAFWLLLTVLCSFAAVAAAIPLVRRYESGLEAGIKNSAIYKDQIGEIEREKAAGSIGEQEAELAKAEIQRRLAAAKSDFQARPLSPAWRTVALVASTAAIVLGSVNLYAWLGSPDMATQPRVASAVPAAAEPVQASGAQPAAMPAAGNQPGQVSDMISQLAARLQSNPNDADGWRTLGWSYFNTQKYQEAAEAYGKALALDPGNADYKSSMAESIVQAAGGIVTPKAKQLFDEVLAKDPKEFRARFYGALALEQAGNQKTALENWLGLLKDAPLDAPWRDDVKQRVVELGKATGEDVSAATAVPSLPPSSQQQLGAQEQSAMVAGMIAKLAAKLEANPRDRDGWAMMIRSLKVNGDAAGAEQALAKALDIFKDDAATQEGLRAIAQGNATAPAAAGNAMQGSAAPQISAEQKATIEAMPQDDQQAMIKSMVARLASKLEENPNDADGWIRLMRSYMVLQDAPSASAAKVKALAAFATDTATQQRITAAAAELGIN